MSAPSPSPPPSPLSPSPSPPPSPLSPSPSPPRPSQFRIHQTISDHENMMADMIFEWPSPQAQYGSQPHKKYFVQLPAHLGEKWNLTPATKVSASPPYPPAKDPNVFDKLGYGQNPRFSCPDIQFSRPDIQFASPPYPPAKDPSVFGKLGHLHHRLTTSNVTGKNKIPNPLPSRPQVGALVHNTPGDYLAEITSTKQEIFHILRELLCDENGGVSATTKNTLVVKLEQELTNKFNLLHLATDPKVLFMAKEYLNNIIELFKTISHLKGSLVTAYNPDANNLESTRKLLEGLITEEFLCAFDQHKETQNGIESRIRKLHTKLRILKVCKKCSKIVFGMVYVAAAISSLVLIVMGLPIGAAATAMGSNAVSFVERLVDSLLADREEAFEGERKIITKILDVHVIFKKLVDDIGMLSMSNTEVITNVVVKETQTVSSIKFENLGNLIDLCTVEMAIAVAGFLKFIVAGDVQLHLIKLASLSTPGASHSQVGC